MLAYQEEVFNDAKSYFESLIQDITNATQSIDIEVYLFKFDKTGKQIANHLIDAAQRGVKVRILVDGIGSIHWGGNIVDAFDKAGVVSKIFHPLPWHIWQLKRAVSQRPWLSNLAHLLSNINSRTHRKVIIIDNKITHIGSFNIDDRHLQWRDTSIRLVNAPIKQLKKSLEQTWSFQSKLINNLQSRIMDSIDTSALIRLNDSRHKRRVLYKHLLKRIAKAKNRIWITNAYFVPDHFLLKKLIDVASNRVDVRILLPQKSDVTVLPWISEFFYAKLHKAGVRIFEYQPNMLHAKTIIIDDWVMVGTSNLNYRSLLHDLEVDVVLKTKQSLSKIVNQFQVDLQHSEEITNPNLQKRSWIKRIIGRSIMLVKYIV